MRPSICVIGVYFGSFPHYFPLWLRSAANNTTIDFLLVTDQELIYLPPNVSKISISLKEFKKLADEKLKVNVRLERPYKCCDLKPAYGLILSDYITQYDFWAHCDFDMIFGDIRSFFERYALQEYDKILDLGHLSFYRNLEENNKRFMLTGSKCGSYREVFESEQNHAFDELNGVYSIFKKHSFKMFDKRIYADISKIYKRFRIINDANYQDQIFVWQNGAIFQVYANQSGVLEKREYIYIHFKERGNLSYKEDCLSSEGFLITPSGFYSFCDSQDAYQAIQKYNKYPGIMFEKIEKLKYNIQSLFIRIMRRIGAYKR